MIIITGQTATGKTKLGEDLAKKYNGELVNCDSRQIYKYLNIITGKDIPKTKIHLYDIVTPDQYFSSFDYVKEAQKVIKDIKKRSKTPIIIGGTYLYLKHLIYGFDTEAPPNFKLREKLNKKTVKKLQKILKKLNPKVFEGLNNSDINNPRRLIRKIEIEKSPSQNRREQKFLFPTRFNLIGLRYKNKEKLKQAIKNRVEKRLKQGAIEEVKSLLKKGYKKTDPGMKTIGYKQIIDYLEGSISKEQAITKWITAEVRYAKRQMTFMKKDKNIKWRLIS